MLTISLIYLVLCVYIVHNVVFKEEYEINGNYTQFLKIKSPTAISCITNSFIHSFINGLFYKLTNRGISRNAITFTITVFKNIYDKININFCQTKSKPGTTFGTLNTRYRWDQG